MSVEKVLVVVNLLEARHFSRCPDSSLVVDGSLNGEVLSTDPVPQAGLAVHIQTELAWEMEPKALQQHRLHRTPVKLQVFTVDNATRTRKLVGYVLMDLRTARTASKVLPRCYKVLNVRTKGPCPELYLSLSVEEQGEEQKGKESGSGKPAIQQQQQLSDQNSVLTLHSSEGFYSLGCPLPHQQPFVLSITLKNPANLPQLTDDDTSCYYYCYNLLENDITSEEFKAYFKPEKASIRIVSTRERLGVLFASIEDMKVCLCQGSVTLGKGSLSLKSLSTKDYLESRIKITSDSVPSSYIDVTVQLEKETPSHMYQNQYKYGSESGQSVKRNLTRSFEEVSDQNINSHNLREKDHEYPQKEGDAGTSSTSSIHSSFNSQEAPEPHSPSQPSDMCSPHPKPVCSESHEQSENKELRLPPNLQHMHLSPTISTDPPLCSQSPPSSISLSCPIHSGTKDVTVSSGSTLPYTCARSCTGTQLSSVNTAPLCHPSPFLATSEIHGCPLMAEEATHRYQYAIDIHSIHNIQLEEGLKCFVRYNYPYFGSHTPVVVLPPISLVLGAEHHIAASYSAFTFASIKSDLMRQLHLQPLSLELWAFGEHKSDTLVGVARIPLGEVFAKEEVISGNITHQKCSLKVPVMAPLLREVTCAYIQCTLVLEDHGPVELSNKDIHPFGRPSITAPATGLQNSSEYVAAMELEVWKLSQEETFAETMKTKGTDYLRRLGDEWRKREEERQKVFTQKVDSYNNLEKQLITALQAAQYQQKQLLTRETEVHQLHHKLMVEKQNLYSNCDAKLQQCQLMYEGKVSAERAKVEELLETVERLKKQVSDLSSSLSSKDREFDAHRQQVLSKPESKLQAEVTMIHMEKSELERKLSTALKSKQHYKEQWNRALKELATYRQRQQTTAREVLQRQLLELESMRARHVHNAEQKSICQHLNEVKDEVSRLQKGTPTCQLSNSQLLPTATCSDTDWMVNPDVARWIEERDVLLQTGLYTHNDLTIQTLDQKIKAALNSN